MDDYMDDYYAELTNLNEHAQAALEQGDIEAHEMFLREIDKLEGGERNAEFGCSD